MLRDLVTGEQDRLAIARLKEAMLARELIIEATI